MSSKNRSSCDSANVESQFFKSSHVGRHFAQIFSDFAKVFTDFSQISMDFAWIFRDFARIITKSTFVGALKPPPSIPLGEYKSFINQNDPEPKKQPQL